MKEALTHSMDPLLSELADGLLIQPDNADARVYRLVEHGAIVTNEQIDHLIMQGWIENASYAALHEIHPTVFYRISDKGKAEYRRRTEGTAKEQGGNK